MMQWHSSLFEFGQQELGSVCGHNNLAARTAHNGAANTDRAGENIHALITCTALISSCTGALTQKLRAHAGTGPEFGKGLGRKVGLPGTNLDEVGGKGGSPVSREPQGSTLPHNKKAGAQKVWAMVPPAPAWPSAKPTSVELSVLQVKRRNSQQP